MGDNMKKIALSVIIVFVVMLLGYSSQVYAMGSVISSGDDFLNIGKQGYANNQPLDEGALRVTSKQVYNILFAIAAVLAIAVGLIIGIQFVTGSVDEKARIKETLIPYVVGCIVIFSAFTIWKIVIEVGTNAEKTTVIDSDRGNFSGGRTEGGGGRGGGF